MSNPKLWINDDGIIRCVLLGLHDKKETEVVIEKANKLSNESGKATVLIDLSKTEESTSGARRIYVDTLKAEAEIIEKLAFLGSSAKRQGYGEFYNYWLREKGKTRYFESEEEALEWLKE